MGDLTKNFSRSELACKHCGQMHLTTDFINRLQALRDRVGFALPVNSGYRCPVHNQAVSSTGPAGPHTKDAVDLRLYGERALMVIPVALELGFTGVGVSQKGAQGARFIHLDDLPNASGQPRPWIWSY